MVVIKGQVNIAGCTGAWFVEWLCFNWCPFPKERNNIDPGFSPRGIDWLFALYMSFNLDIAKL